MEEPAGPIHWSMGKRAVVWIVGAEADVSACPYSVGCQVLPGRLSSVASLIRHLGHRLIMAQPNAYGCKLD